MGLINLNGHSRKETAEIIGVAPETNGVTLSGECLQARHLYLVGHIDRLLRDDEVANDSIVFF